MRLIPILIELRYVAVVLFVGFDVSASFFGADHAIVVMLQVGDYIYISMMV